MLSPISFTSANMNGENKEQEGIATENDPDRVDLPRTMRLGSGNICNIFSLRDDTLEEYAKANKVDEENIKSTFKWLDFEVDLYPISKSRHLKEEMGRIATEDYSRRDISVVFILAHGDDKRRIQTSDKQMTEIDTLIDRFVRSDELHGIPKLFFIQGCRGEEEMEAVVTLERDSHFKRAGVKETLRAQKADTLTFYSTTQGNNAWVGHRKGSPFVDILCKVLQSYCVKDNLHLGDVIAKVNDMLSLHTRKIQDSNMVLVQVSEVSHTLTKHIYFPQPQGTYKEFMKNYDPSSCSTVL